MCIDGSHLVQKGSVVGRRGDICSQVGLDVAELFVMSEVLCCFFLQRSRTIGQLVHFESLTSSCATHCWSRMFVLCCWITSHHDKVFLTVLSLSPSNKRKMTKSEWMRMQWFGLTFQWHRLGREGGEGCQENHRWLWSQLVCQPHLLSA